MLGAGAPGARGQYSRGTGTPGRLRVIVLTYVLVALELTCLFMRFSILPYLTRQLGLDSVAFGYLQTTFGVLQLLGGPLFGRFADQRGARAAFTLSFLAASAFYLLLAAACSPSLPGLALLYAAPLPAALAHGLPAAQMVIADLSAPEERPAALGRLGLCFGVGMILGSLLGGTLSAACGIQCPAFVALVASLVAAVLSFTCIPTSTKGVSANAQATPPGAPKASIFDLKAISRLLLQPGVLPVFLVKVVSGFPSGLFLVMFSIISMDFFQLDAAQAGYLTSFFGVLQMVIQGVVIGWLSSHFSEGTLLRASVLIFIAVGVAMALMSNVLHFCLLMPGLVFSLCALNVVTDSMLTKAVSASDTGTMLGLCASIQPLTRTVGPTVGGLLYRSFGVPVFGHVQFATNVLVLLVLWRQPLPQKRDKVG
ncbi:solute carrier family 22 member 18 isoform X1 [Canis lupus baileyi]|uniref:Organic cation transporter-like protein 2 n=2 Tax=Canis lupus TaxID=9612 RepID=A0A8C0Q2Z7_CANLF|nr:solute carrier family 22 member 18 isoform X2 [Canis lupus dingo]XP_038419523.1 LOW QUALITY PROTEIN: solute carrier family 22 member 18 isoform X1 [Canis lupus familiaris]